MKNISENNNEEKENILNNELDNLEKSKTEMSNENMILRQIIKEHKFCPKKRQN